MNDKDKPGHGKGAGDKPDTDKTGRRAQDETVFRKDDATRRAPGKPSANPPVQPPRDATVMRSRSPG